MKYLVDQPDLVAEFVARMIPHVGALGFGRCRAIGVVDDNHELVAGLVYHHMDPHSGIIEMSGAALPGHQWATRETLKLMYQYPFLQVGAQMVVMRVLYSDERLLRQLAALNYEFIRVPRLFGRDRDGVLCLLTYEDWVANKLCRRFGHHVPDTQAQEAA